MKERRPVQDRFASLPATRLCVLVGVIVAVAVAAGTWSRATYGARTTADEPHYLLTAISLAEDRDLDVADERADLRYVAFHAAPLPQQAEVQDRGRQVAPHDPLLPVLLAVPVGAAGWIGAKLALAAIAGVLAAVMAWTAIHRFAVRPLVAAVAALLAGASPPLAIYGTQVYPELVAALVALLGYLAATARAGPRTALAAVVCVSALPWLSVKYVLVAAVLAAGVLLQQWTARRPRLVLGTTAALVASAAVYVVGHVVLYGGLTAYAAGSHFAAGELTVVGNDPDYVARSVRLAGLLVDRHFGLVPWQPAFLAAPVALGWLLWTSLRRATPSAPGVPAGDRLRRVLLVAVVVAGWATATWIALTMHGWWWPGRQTVVVVPLLVVAIASWADGLAPLAQRLLAGVAALGVLAYAVVAWGATAGWHTLIVDFDRTPNPVLWLLRPLFPDLRADGIATDLQLTAWIVVLVATVLLAVRPAIRRRRAPARAVAVGP
ncbi:MAG TPA: hypothetical protein VG478_00260 [Acidimicrobiales bacterium]|nr:hypothetical protein [Acidimicrobiales bacterium]